MDIFKAFGLHKRDLYPHEKREARSRARFETYLADQAKREARAEERDKNRSDEWLAIHPGPARLSAEEIAAARPRDETPAMPSQHEQLLGLTGPAKTGLSNTAAQARISDIIANPQVGEDTQSKQNFQGLQVRSMPSPESQARLARIMEPEKRPISEGLRQTPREVD